MTGLQNGIRILDTDIIFDRPPNWSDILKVFPLAQRGAIFAYNNAIYNPFRYQLSRPLIEHEKVHLQRMGNLDGTIAWWDRYLADPAFRYEEELLAHVAEYEAYLREATCRQMRRGAIKIVSEKLSQPLYKFTVSRRKAADDITAHIFARNRGQAGEAA